MRPWPKFFIQTVIGYALLAPVAFVVGITGLIYEGFQTVFALALFVIFAPISSIAVAVLIGLPLRLIPAAAQWWARYGWLGFPGIALGVMLLIFSFLFGGNEAVDFEGVSHTMFVPNGLLLLTGWMMLAFFAAHTWISLAHLRTFAGRLRRAVSPPSSAGAQ